jgi:5-methyltetrahydropteroyltriglutamate--homocysteine methyltransferase
MATPRFDVLFPTMVVGSLPRPQWVVDVVHERNRGTLAPRQADRLLDDAVVCAIRLQERAGLDYVSDGEWRRKNYARVFADKVGGFRHERVQRGTLGMHAFVEKPIERRGPIVLEEAEFLKRNTSRKTLVTLPAPCTVADLMWHPVHSAAAYPSRRAFVSACAEILREEIAELGRLGIDAVQLDEPLLSRLANPSLYNIDPEKRREEVDLSVEMVNQVVDGLEGIFISAHLCHGHGNNEAIPAGTELMRGAVQGMRVDRFAMEFNSGAGRSMQSLADFPRGKILGLGVVVPGDVEVESPEVVVQRARAALVHIDKERMVLNPDCGFATTAGSGELLDRAYLKLRALCEGARRLRAATDLPSPCT